MANEVDIPPEYFTWWYKCGSRWLVTRLRAIFNPLQTSAETTWRISNYDDAKTVLKKSQRQRAEAGLDGGEGSKGQRCMKQDKTAATTQTNKRGDVSKWSLRFMHQREIKLNVDFYELKMKQENKCNLNLNLELVCLCIRVK